MKLLLLSVAAAATVPVLAATAGTALPQALPGHCVYPADCRAPKGYEHSRVMPVQSRQQWEDSGGFCGSLSIQAIAMSYGAWISQDQVRKAADPGGGHGDKDEGYEILHTNIEGALDTLKLTYEAWDYNQTLPQVDGYLRWLKKQLAAGSPVVWMIMCKGDGHDTYGIANYDHVEPVWGIYSKHDLSDLNIYPDDVLVHGADYGAYHKIEGPHLYRRFDTLADSKKMDGNCSEAGSYPGKNEYYPCIPNDGPDWGFAITGVVEPSNSTDVPAFLAVDEFDEPDLREGRPASELTGTLTIGPGLKKHVSYRIYRWDDYRDVPTNGDYESSKFTHKYDFVATGPTFKFKDKNTIRSSGTTYYRVQPHLHFK